jgi:hypothetical protein
MISAKTWPLLLALSFLVLAFPLTARGIEDASDTSRIRLVLDASEADAVLAILSLRSDGTPIGDAEWKTLFSSEPYRRLKDRQAVIADMFQDSTIVLRDEDFKRFALSDDPLGQYPDLKQTVERWKGADLYASARKVLGYLPDSARIRAKVYPIIKKSRNTFVWEASTNPAIFLSVNPKMTGGEFANTVAHELHHIGLSSIRSGYEMKTSTLSEEGRSVARWIGAFGEGMAMLAAAGRPDIHPHATSSEEDRARWDRDMANFSANLDSVASFFGEILNGTLADEDAVQKKAFSFFGIQGPWYTVGYRMSVMVEKRFGRDALIQTMLDPRKLLVLYNRAAEEQNAAGGDTLPLWPEEMLQHIDAE